MGWRWVDFTTTTTYIAMPLATAITSRAGGRSLAMATDIIFCFLRYLLMKICTYTRFCRARAPCASGTKSALSVFCLRFRRILSNSHTLGVITHSGVELAPVAQVSLAEMPFCREQFAAVTWSIRYE